MRRKLHLLGAALMALALPTLGQSAPKNCPSVPGTVPDCASTPTANSGAPVQGSRTTATSTPPAETDQSLGGAQGPVAAAPKHIILPAGTKVLLQLRSGVNTKTARPGDGVYLESTFPVADGEHVVLPAGLYVQGTIDRVIRPGRVKGRAEVGMHFNSMIFPNGSVVMIPGVVDALPGASDHQVKDGEGTIQEDGSKGKDAGAIAKTTAEGAGIGTLAGAAAGNVGTGLGIGAGAGLAAGVLQTLFTRGNDVIIEQGTPVEMILQRPLELKPEQLAGLDVSGNSPVGYAPVPGRAPLAKPGRRMN